MLHIYQGNNSPAYTSTGSSTGTLAVTEGASTINVVVLGSYFAGSFVASSDGHGGTLVTDPPPPSNPTASLGGTYGSITANGDLDNNTWGASSDLPHFSDGSTMNIGQPASGQGAPPSFTWIGMPNASSISETGIGSNTFEFGAGSESFTGGTKSNGGSGNNMYLASTIQATIAGTTNELDFNGGVTDQNRYPLPWKDQLRPEALATDTGGSEIAAGALNIDSQVSQLVQAMATYSANNSGFDPTASSVHAIPNDSGVQASMAPPWHG
jgi:hypothetical protein